MARRLSFPHDTPAADLLAWIASAVAEGFHVPRRLPSMQRPPVQPEPPAPLLFEGLPSQRRGEPAVPAPPPPGMPLSEVMLRHFAGVIAGPSELALKRRKLKAERAAAAREPEIVAAEPPPSPQDVAYVQAAILDILPKGWPSYAKEVLGIRKDRGVWICRLRLFAGEIGTLRLSGQPGAHGYGWELGVRDKRPFHFDEAAWNWVRLDDDAASGSPQI